MFNNDLFTEAYSGKTKTLLKIEKLLDDMSNRMKVDPDADYTNSFENKQICNLFKEQFGFKNVYIIWRRTPRMAPNAFTLISVNVLWRDKGKFYDKNKKNFYDKHHKHTVYIEISQSMARDMDLSGAEYLAIILHEIGHNFDASPYMVISVIFNWIKLLAQIITRTVIIDPETQERMIVKRINPQAILSMVLSTNPGKAVYGTIQHAFELIKDVFKPIKRFMSFLRMVSSEFIKAIIKITTPILIVPQTLMYGILSPVYHLMTVPTRKTEIFADSFALYYGYSVELSKALDKLTDGLMTRNSKGKVVELTGINRLLTDIAMTQYYLTLVLIGADHGSNETRLLTNMKIIEKELNENKYPPEVEKDLRNQINGLKEVYSVFKSGGEQSLALLGGAREIVESIFGGRSDYIAKFFPTYIATKNDEPLSLEESTDTEIDDIIDSIISNDE